MIANAQYRSYIFHLRSAPCAFEFRDRVVRCLHRGDWGVAALTGTCATDGEAVSLAYSSGQLVGAPETAASGADPALFELLDQIAESVLVVSPVWDQRGALTAFTI